MRVLKKWYTYLLMLLTALLAVFLLSEWGGANALGSYEEELASFPSDYQSLLAKLHAAHPNWIFVAVDAGDWETAVTAESKTGISLINKNYSAFLLNNTSDYYNASTGAYKVYDGTTWVQAGRNTVAWFMDPRNFLDETYIWLFESLNYDNVQTLDGVKSILNGTDMASAENITYYDTAGTKQALDITYAEAVYQAGLDNSISPYYLAAKIIQEVGGNTSGTATSGLNATYPGIYNFYNIGASSGSNAAVTGLKWASGNGTGATSYGRPWTTPVLSISGGAGYIASSYISKGQNTLYLQRFNVTSYKTYSHQYMTSIYSAAAEARTTSKASKSSSNTYVFYIPVYNSMPSQDATVSFTRTVDTATTTKSATLRATANSSDTAVATISKGKTVTVLEVVENAKPITSSSVTSFLYYPYWVKVSYGSYTGYLCASDLSFDASYSVAEGSTLNLAGQLTASNAGTITYYSTDPAVATISSSGVVTGVDAGSCSIYAISSGGQLDAVGIKVTSGGGTGGETGGETGGDSNTDSYTYTEYVTTARVNYRSGPGTSYAVKGTLAKGSTVQVVDGSDKTANGYTWYMVKINGSFYYVASSYLKASTAGESWTTYYTTTAVNYRSGPGTNYTVKGTLASGTSVQVADGYSASANGYTWAKIKVNGSYYYVAIKYLTTTAPATGDNNTTTAYTTTAKVNYRTGPGTSYAVKGTLAKGTTVNVVDGYSKAANGYTWYKVKIGSSCYYVVSKYLKATTGSTPTSTTTMYTTTRVNYRTGPGTSYGTKGTLAAGAAVKMVVGYSAKANGYDWAKIEINGSYYYVALKYLSATKAGTAPNTTTATVTMTTSARVNYRTGPGTSYSASGTLAKGTSVSVYTDDATVAGGYTWYKVSINGKYYYIAGAYLTRPVVTYTTTARVNYRTGPGTSYSAKGTLAKGATVNVVSGVSYTANGYTWYQVEIGGGYYYIASTYLTKS